MRDIVDEENLLQHIQLEVEVVSAVWNEDLSVWVVQSRDRRGNKDELREEHFNFLANASGFLK